MSCTTCIDEARERMRDFDNIKQKAKKHAEQNQTAFAICKEGDTGSYFIATAIEAITNGCIIVEIVSDM